MKMGYYPGCSLKGSARDYAMSIRGCCDLLGVELAELDDWNCCGATAAHSINQKAALGLPLRNIGIASKAGLDMLVPCPLCFNRLKTAQADSDVPGENVGIWDLPNFFATDNLLNKIESMVKKPLSWLKAVCYYGCMASRPPRITGERAYENPDSMDRILKAIGADVRDWSFKTDCCGASHLVARPDIVFTLVRKLYEEARRAGAECIVVSCQMCQASLDLHQSEIWDGQSTLPVVYFTELIGLALGHRDVKKWLRSHFVDPVPLLYREREPVSEVSAKGLSTERTQGLDLGR